MILCGWIFMVTILCRSDFITLKGWQPPFFWCFATAQLQLCTAPRVGKTNTEAVGTLGTSGSQGQVSTAYEVPNPCWLNGCRERQMGFLWWMDAHVVYRGRGEPYAFKAQTNDDCHLFWQLCMCTTATICKSFSLVAHVHQLLALGCLLNSDHQPMPRYSRTMAPYHSSLAKVEMSKLFVPSFMKIRQLDLHEIKLFYSTTVSVEIAVMRCCWETNTIHSICKQQQSKLSQASSLSAEDSVSTDHRMCIKLFD